MTTEEMKSRILDYCEMTRCRSCKLSKNKRVRNCHLTATPEEIKENYEILFGKEEDNMEMFKKEDIKPGYIVEITDQDGVRGFAMITYNKDGELCISSSHTWSNLDDFDDDLKRKSDKSVRITKVYGCAPNAYAYCLAMNGRDLLWDGYEPKEMTMKEIEEALGYPVKIVKE